MNPQTPLVQDAPETCRDVALQLSAPQPQEVTEFVRSQPLARLASQSLALAAQAPVYVQSADAHCPPDIVFTTIEVQLRTLPQTPQEEAVVSAVSQPGVAEQSPKPG